MKQVFLGVICILLALMFLGTFICPDKNAGTYTFSAATGGRSEKAESAQDAEGTDMAGRISYYGEGYFRRYTGDVDRSVTRSISFYDGRGKELFQMAELDSKNFVRISVDGRQSVYRFIPDSGNE